MKPRVPAGGKLDTGMCGYGYAIGVSLHWAGRRWYMVTNATHISTATRTILEQRILKTFWRFIGAE